MAKGAGKARKKLPKELAVVRADSCTGCEACIEVCPVDCIYKVPGIDQPVLQSFVDIDLERCIGCDLCERWCPWDAIEMIPPLQIAEAVAQKGGPPLLATCSPMVGESTMSIASQGHQRSHSEQPMQRSRSMSTNDCNEGRSSPGTL